MKINYGLVLICTTAGIATVLYSIPLLRLKNFEKRFEKVKVIVNEVHLFRDHLQQMDKPFRMFTGDGPTVSQIMGGFVQNKFFSYQDEFFEIEKLYDFEAQFWWPRWHRNKLQILKNELIEFAKKLN